MSAEKSFADKGITAATTNQLMVIFAESLSLKRRIFLIASCLLNLAIPSLLISLKILTLSNLAIFSALFTLGSDLCTFEICLDNFRCNLSQKMHSRFGFW